jgi:hypothetical protein
MLSGSKKQSEERASNILSAGATCYVIIGLHQGINSLARTQILFVLTQTIYSFLQGSS